MTTEPPPARVPDPGASPVRLWSLLFCAIAVAVVGVYVYAPFDANWWLPKSASQNGPLHLAKDIDGLFLLILWITGIVFIGTQVALVWATWKYAETPGRRAQYFHGSQRLEVIWTIIPAAILTFLALYQMGTWTAIKFRSAKPKVAPVAEVTARQFQWLIRYPGPDGKVGTEDDLQLVNDLHCVKGEAVLINLKSRDVLHSFFLPRMRIKQDAVPGLTIPVWFDADEAGKYEIVCAELCGWGHYKMKAGLTVHGSQAEFQEWQDKMLKEQNRDQLAVAARTQGEN